MLYEYFKLNSFHFENGLLKKQFLSTPGYGEMAFSWNWHLLVKDMPTSFRFMEVGVYKGRILSLIQLLANHFGKQAQIVGVTPLANVGDKYSSYDDTNYLQCIKDSFAANQLTFDNCRIIQGYSQNPDVVTLAGNQGTYDMIFIDGCHDYEIVCQDIRNYGALVRPGGYLVLDDASLYLDNAFGEFLGHPDVGRAVQDVLDNDPNFTHLWAVGHNRVWLRNQ